MQVEPRYRKSIKKWVVDTRAKGIKKLNGGVGEQKEFVCKEAADAYCVRINQQQASGGAVSQHTAGTLRQAYEFFQTEIDMNIGDVWTYHYGAGLKTDLGHYCDLVLDGEAMPFGEFKCVDITPADCKRATKQLKRDRNLSDKTRKQKEKALRALFDYARVDLEWCNHNPAARVKLKKSKYGSKVKKAPKIRLEKVNVSDVCKLVDYLLENQKVARRNPGLDQTDQIVWNESLAVATLAETGLRFSEMAALEMNNPEHINLETGRITVQQVVRKVGHKQYAIESVGKTSASFRTIPITEELIKQLRLWKLRCPAGTKYWFGTRENTFHTASTNLNRRIIFPACDAVKIKRMTCHEFRHFYATLLLDIHHDDWSKITRLMGHTKISFTYDVYGHWIDDEESDRADAARFAERLARR